MFTMSSVRFPPYEKKNKVSSGAEDNAKLAEVGTRKVGHWRDLVEQLGCMLALLALIKGK